MTYAELAKRINELPKENQEQDVTILLMDSDEVKVVLDFVAEWESIKPQVKLREYHERGINQVDGVLDEGHPFLSVAF